MKYLFSAVLPVLFFLTPVSDRKASTDVALFNDTIHFEGETHFKNIRQLTFGGDNAEAYFSYDGKYLIFQKTNAKEGIPCDQIWM